MKTINNHDCIIIDPTNPPTPTPTVSNSATHTPTPTTTASATPPLTPTPTQTSTQTKTPTRSPPPTPSTTSTLTSTPTPTNTITASITPSNTPTPTPPSSPTATVTPTNTCSPTKTMRPTGTPTPTCIFCNSFGLPDTFTFIAVWYGTSQQDPTATMTRTGNTWSGSGTFPCGVSWTVSMTCDPILGKFIYDGSLSCGTGKSIIFGPTDTPAIFPGSTIPPIVVYADISDCPPECIDVTTTHSWWN